MNSTPSSNEWRTESCAKCRQERLTAVASRQTRIPFAGCYTEDQARERRMRSGSCGMSCFKACFSGKQAFIFNVQPCKLSQQTCSMEIPCIMRSVFHSVIQARRPTTRRRFWTCKRGSCSCAGLSSTKSAWSASNCWPP